MSAALPFSLVLPKQCGVLCLLNRFILTDQDGAIIGYVYSNLLIYPLDPEFYMKGRRRIMEYLEQQNIPIAGIAVSRECTHILRKEEKASVVGQDVFSVKITGPMLAHTDNDFVQDIFSAFYGQKIAVSISSVF